MSTRKKLMVICLLVMFICSALVIIIGLFYDNPMTSERMLTTGSVGMIITVLGMFYYRWLNN